MHKFDAFEFLNRLLETVFVVWPDSFYTPGLRLNRSQKYIGIDTAFFHRGLTSEPRPSLYFLNVLGFFREFESVKDALNRRQACFKPQILPYFRLRSCRVSQFSLLSHYYKALPNEISYPSQ